MPDLSIILWLPALCGLLALALPSERAAGLLAVAAGGATLALAIWLIAGYRPGAGLSDVTDVVWIAVLGIHYKLAISGLNVFLIGLTALLFLAALLASMLRLQREGLPRARGYLMLMLLMESAVLGAFLAQDIALFIIFFDLMLIPSYFLIGMFGSGDRVKATTKLVIYTLAGSLLMLVGVIATGVIAASAHGTPITFAISALQALPISRGSQEWIFLLFAVAFLVKMPAFPLQGWMPDGYRAMPIEVVMVFSGVLSKVGAYGFLAIVLPLFPQAAVHFQMALLVIALVSIIYGSALAFTQTDARLIAGYSSIAQLGFITLGIFALNAQGAQGALLGMVNHGLVVAPIFFIIALLAKRAGGSEDIREMGGIAFRAPLLASIFLVVALATLAMPGSANFAGELLILLGVFKSKLTIALIATSGVAMAAVYALRLFIRAMHNRAGERVHSFEMSAGDGLVLAPLLAVILLLAFYPQLALERSEGAVKAALLPARGALREPAARTAAQGAVEAPAGEGGGSGGETPGNEGATPEGGEAPSEAGAAGASEAGSAGASGAGAEQAGGAPSGAHSGAPGVAGGSAGARAGSAGGGSGR